MEQAEGRATEKSHLSVPTSSPATSATTSAPVQLGFNGPAYTVRRPVEATLHSVGADPDFASAIAPIERVAGVTVKPAKVGE